MTSTVSRRRLIGQTALASVALATPLSNLAARQKLGRRRFRNNPYGPLVPTRDRATGLHLLRLPRGFRYRSFGWTGDLMSDGAPTPARHDGMAVVAQNGFRELILVRNHEVGIDLPVGGPETPRYDFFELPGIAPGLGGGTTNLRLRHGRLVESWGSLAGTTTNCAGGPTPWGSWLTCEEATVRGALVGAEDHGYVFEVPAEEPASAVPIRDMGLMDHEAVAVDEHTGIVYLTEDNGNTSGFYRFLPNDPSPRVGALEAGGQLEMLKVVGVDNADLSRPEAGDLFDVEWVSIADPDSDPEAFVPPDVGFPPVNGTGRSGPYLQGEALGAARFNRGEGCWSQDGVIYFVDTSGGAAGKGSVWAYLPGPEKLYAVYVSPSEAEADNPDNITVSPRGGLLLCEDGGGQQPLDGPVRGTRLIGVGGNGRAFEFAENNMLLDDGVSGRPLIDPNDYRSQEFAGACFDARGRTLFVNIQTPGVTFAIRGPWRRGPL